MKKIFSILICFISTISVAQTPCIGGVAGAYACDGYDLQSSFTLNDLNAGSGNDSWGWTDPNNGDEYALVGLNNGTAFINITDPINPVYLGKLPTHSGNSSWRDIKVYNDHAFVVSEAGGHGMQVFDLTRLRSVASPPATFTEDAHYNGFGSAHNIVINEDSGFAYGVGTSSFNGGPHFVNIQNPTNPVAAGGYAMDNYSHDAQVITYNGPDTDYTGKEVLFGSNENELVIVDITDKSNPVSISSISYTNVGYTHQGWFTEDSRYFIVGDETDELNFGFDTRTIVFDLNDLDNPQHHFDYSGTTSAIDHNGYIVGDKYYFANYRAGIRVLDVSDIANGNMSEIGYFDTFPNSNSAQFDGAWNVYPFFASGNIVISDIDRGFFLVKSSTPDTTDPIAVCQDITASLGANGEVTIDPNDVDGGSSDDSGSFTATLDTNTFSCSDIGTNPVILTITDPSGNTDTCNAVITIVDDMAPEIDCPTDITVAPDSGETYFTLPDYVALNEATGTDNCLSPISISQDPVAGTQLTDGTHTISFESTDPSGNVGTCTFVLTVDETLGFDENELNVDFNIYPNPTSNLIHVVSKNQMVNSVVIYDILGKSLFSGSNINSEQVVIDISGYSKGMYFLKINNNTTKKIIKE